MGPGSGIEFYEPPGCYRQANMTFEMVSSADGDDVGCNAAPPPVDPPPTVWDSLNQDALHAAAGAKAEAEPPGEQPPSFKSLLKAQTKAKAQRSAPAQQSAPSVIETKKKGASPVADPPVAVVVEPLGSKLPPLDLLALESAKLTRGRPPAADAGDLVAESTDACKSAPPVAKPQEAEVAETRALPAAAPVASIAAESFAAARPSIGSKPRKEVPMEVLIQDQLGPQSKRGGSPQQQLDVLDHNPHAKACFEEFARREVELCGEWAVFYHSYSFPALLYEMHSAIHATVFASAMDAVPPLPRLMLQAFRETPDAKALLQRFDQQFTADQKDHHPEYRAVGISAMCSLVALGPEASTPVVFIGGYSHADDPVDYRGVLVLLLTSLVTRHHCPKKTKASLKKLSNDINRLTDNIIGIAERHGLDAYASHPWGVLDKERHPFSKWIDGDSNANWGQARIVAHPEIFTRPDMVRLHAASADPSFHRERATFQRELVALLRNELLNSESLMSCAAEAICDGSPPASWHSAR